MYKSGRRRDGWDGTTAQLIREEQDEFAALLAEFAPEEWEHPTLCEGWTVRNVVADVAADIHDKQLDQAIVAQYTAAQQRSSFRGSVRCRPSTSTRRGARGGCSPRSNEASS